MARHDDVAIRVSPSDLPDEGEIVPFPGRVQVCVGLVQQEQRMVMSSEPHHTKDTEQLLFPITNIVERDFAFSAFPIDPDAHIPDKVRKSRVSR